MMLLLLMMIVMIIMITLMIMMMMMRRRTTDRKTWPATSTHEEVCGAEHIEVKIRDDDNAHNRNYT